MKLIRCDDTLVEILFGKQITAHRDRVVLANVWRAILRRSATPMTPICLTCKKAHGICRCAHQGRYITASTFVYHLDKQRTTLSDVRGWGVSLEELKQFTVVRVDTYRPDFRTRVKEAVTALLEHAAAAENPVVPDATE